MSGWDVVKKALPVIATTLGGPLAGLAVELVGQAFGISEPTVDKVKSALAGATPEQIAQLTIAENQLKERLVKMGYEHVEKLEELNVRTLEAINKTMQAEAIAERWPQYSWRPFIGFVFGINTAVVTGVASTAYIAAIFLGKPEYLEKLPEFVQSMTTLLAVVMPVLGIAAWFRGKMQADPNIPMLPKK
jgi:hypothetical protein